MTRRQRRQEGRPSRRRPPGRAEAHGRQLLDSPKMASPADRTHRRVSAGEPDHPGPPVLRLSRTGLDLHRRLTREQLTAPRQVALTSLCPRSSCTVLPLAQVVSGRPRARGGSSRRRSLDGAVDLEKAPHIRRGRLHPEKRRTSRDDAPYPEKLAHIPRRRPISRDDAVHPEMTRHSRRSCRTSGDNGLHLEKSAHIRGRRP